MPFDFGDGRPVLALFAKAHVRGYTKKDGTFVAPHEDKRVAKDDPNMIRLYHGSPERLSRIEDKGLFGGVFASADREAAASHGDMLNEIGVPEKDVLTQHDLGYQIDHEKVVGALKEAMPWLSDDDIEVAYEAVIEDKSVHDADEDEVLRVFREDDMAGASWEAQRIRGAVAAKLGYKAVAMQDEHGTTYLVLPGAAIKPAGSGDELAKSHPIDQAAARGTPATDLNDGEIRRNPGEPSPEQAKTDRYKKPLLKWNGLSIRVENPAGSVRRGRDRAGKTWETRMVYDYGYVERSEGVDGDEVDVYVGPNPDAPMVYVVHQRKYGDWEAYDEDKAMLGFDSQQDAEAAYLQHYDDPRFLGPITAMPVEEFKQKVRATKKEPAMIKGMVLFFKARVGPYLRQGKLVNVSGYDRQGASGSASQGQMEMFGAPGKSEKKPADGRQQKFYVTMIRDGKKTAWLAGPFASHDEARQHVEHAKKEAMEVDPWAHFDAFGVTGVTAEKHPPGVLNERLGLNHA